MRGGTVQAALARAGARAAVADQTTAELMAQTQTLRERLQATRKALNTAYSLVAAQRDHEHLTQLQRAERALDNELSTALDRLQTVLPQYPELTAPVPIAIDAVAQLLHTDEALLSLFYTARPGLDLAYPPRASLSLPGSGGTAGHTRRAGDQNPGQPGPTAQCWPGSHAIPAI